MYQDLPFDVLLFLHSRQFHAVFPKAVFSALLDVGNPLPGLYGLDVEVAVVLEWLIALLFELED